MIRALPSRWCRRWTAAALAAFTAGLLLVTGRAVHPATAQPPDAPALLRLLAERALASLSGPSGMALPARLLPGALPPGLAFEPPVPAGGRLIGSVVRPSFARGPLGPGQPAGESVTIILDAPGSPSDVFAFYEAALRERGWSSPAGRGSSGGFVSSAGPAGGAPFCLSSQGPFVILTATPLAEGVSDVRIIVDTGNPGPCGPPPGLPPPLADDLPALTPPPGVQLLFGGGSVSPASRVSESIALTTLGVAELEAHFAGQLAAAGWVRLDSGAGGPLAWSVWRLPGEGERQRFLYVLEGPGPDQRTLHLRAASPDPGAGIGPSSPLVIPVPAPP